MNYNHIIEKLPYSEPFLFVDQLDYLDENGVEGTFTFMLRTDRPGLLGVIYVG